MPFIKKLALVLFSILALFYLLIIGKNLLAPLFFSLLMALLLLPLSNFLERKWHFRRSLSSFVAVILMISVISVIVFFFGNQLSSLAQDWPQLRTQGERYLDEIQLWISNTFHISYSNQLQYLSDSAEKAFSTSATVVIATISTLSMTFMFSGFTLLFTFFFLNYRSLLYKFLIEVFKKDEHKEKVSEIVNQVQHIIKRYIIGLFLQIVIVTVLITVVLSIMGVKYAVLLGFMSGIFNVIPYLGILFSLLVSCLITIATAGGAKVLMVVLAFIVVHAIDGNIIMPLVVGSKVKINALFAFIGIIVGEMVWGIPGMFLCIPYLAIMKIVFERVDDLQPWARLLGESEKPNRKRRVFKLSKHIEIKEVD